MKLVRKMALVALVVALPYPAAASGGPSGPYGRGTPCETTIKPPPPKCANFDCSDPMFRLHPPRGTYVSAHCAEMPIPLHYYDGEGALLFGPADLGALRALTAGSGYHPVASEDGHGIAVLTVADFRDTGVGPYREIAIDFPVNEESVTVSTQNPYAFLSETFNPQNKLWAHKLILSELMPIDWGREILGYDKNPAPQRITVHTTADETTFAAADPLGNPILSGHLAVDADPRAQAQAVSQLLRAPHGGKLWERFLTGGGLARVNVVNPDVLHRSMKLMESYALLRLKSPPVVGLVGSESALTVEPSSDFGGALSRIDFRPVVSARMSIRMHLDTGFAP